MNAKFYHNEGDYIQVMQKAESIAEYRRIWPNHEQAVPITIQEWCKAVIAGECWFIV